MKSVVDPGIVSNVRATDPIYQPTFFSKFDKP